MPGKCDDGGSVDLEISINVDGLTPNKYLVDTSGADFKLVEIILNSLMVNGKKVRIDYKEQIITLR